MTLVKQLKKKDAYCLKVGKGKALVIMNKKEYDKRVHEKLKSERCLIRSNE